MAVRKKARQGFMATVIPLRQSLMRTKIRVSARPIFLTWHEFFRPVSLGYAAFFAAFTHVLLWCFALVFVHMFSPNRPLLKETSGASASRGSQRHEKSSSPADQQRVAQTPRSLPPPMSVHLVPRQNVPSRPQTPRPLAPTPNPLPRQSVAVPRSPVPPQAHSPAPRAVGGEPSPAAPWAQDVPTPLGKTIEKFLPKGDAAFMESQRNMGQVLGEGAVGGDTAHEDQVGGSPGVGTPQVNAAPKPRFATTEHGLLQYTLGLSKRFDQAWGNERFLPAGAFQGIVGELIQYDIVINRNGTLRKIVNVSALAQPDRDFSAVDKLVIDVFKAVFPFNPVPARIQKDPLVIRKAIRYSGVRYFMY